MKSIRDQVIEFHMAMDLPVFLQDPRVPPNDRVRLRARLIAEEVLEFCEACWPDSPGDWDKIRTAIESVIEKHTPHPNLVQVADALADIAYVVEGSNLEFGIDSGPGVGRGASCQSS